MFGLNRSEPTSVFDIKIAKNIALLSLFRVVGKIEMGLTFHDGTELLPDS